MLRTKGMNARRAGTQKTIETMERRQLLSIQFAADLDLGVADPGLETIGNIGRIVDYKGKALIQNWNKEWYISAGTQATTTLLHSATSGFMDELVATPGKAFARFWRDGTVKHDLWVTEGTPQTTIKITPATLDDDEGAHFAFGSKLFFAGSSPSDRTERPWISDGTMAGTVQLIDVPLSNTKPVELNGFLYFIGGTGSSLGLYKTNGTPAGTSRIYDLPSGNAPTTLGTAGGNVLIPMFGKFLSVTPAGVGTQIHELYFTDQFVTIGNTAYFNAKGPLPGDTAGEELWRTDGTAGGTYLVKDIRPGTGASFPDNLIRVGDKIMFVADTDETGSEWWVSDGMEVGTKMAGEVTAGTNGLNRAALNGTGHAAIGNVLYFRHNTATAGAELWRADGSATGTQMVEDLYAGVPGGDPWRFAAVGNTLYFGASDGTHHGELFKYSAVNAPPTAALSGTPTVNAGAAPMIVQVRWTDSDGINIASLGNGDITVALPNGTTATGVFTGHSGAAADLVATYQIAAPTGGWDFTCGGTFQVNTVAGQVSDTLGQANQAASLGSFIKTFLPPVVSNPLAVTGTDADDQITVTISGGVVSVSVNGAITRYQQVDVTQINITALAGADRIDVSGTIPVSIVAGTGNDTIYSGSGADTIYSGDGDDLAYGGAGDDTVYGNFGNDTLDGGIGNDSLMGGLDLDSMIGNDGDDFLAGGNGSDTIHGSAGNDYIEGKGKADFLYGDAGNDTILGGAGTDEVYGGDGDDRLEVSDIYELNGIPGSFIDHVYGGDGIDTCLHDSLDVLDPTVETPLT